MIRKQFGLSAVKERREIYFRNKKHSYVPFYRKSRFYAAPVQIATILINIVEAYELGWAFTL